MIHCLLEAAIQKAIIFKVAQYYDKTMILH